MRNKCFPFLAGLLVSAWMLQSSTITVSDKSQSGISAALGAACQGSGVVILPDGAYAIPSGVHLPSNCALQAQNRGQAILNATTNTFALFVDGNNVTIDGLVLNGAGIITTQSDKATPQSGVTITHNTIQNISSGKYGISSHGYWKGFNIQYNHFSDISSVPWDKVSTSTNVENGNDGLGMENVNGMDQTTINYNTFTRILGDGMHFMFNWTLGKTAGTYNKAANNDLSYNTFTEMHRMAIEIQGTSGACPGGCVWANAANVGGLTIKGNFHHHQHKPYWNSMGYSLVPDGSIKPLFLNNTAVYGEGSSCDSSSNAMENSGNDQLAQGNVLSSSSACSNNWSQYFETGSIPNGHLITHQNNLLCGGTAKSANYFAWEGKNQHTGNPTYGTTLDRYNYTNATCPNAASPSTSTLNLAFISPDKQNFSVAGTGTWSLYATDEISVRYVDFFIDDALTPSVRQELQDLNTNFAQDMRWLYHAGIDTAALSKGPHTITAVATDVSGLTKMITQTFTTETGGIAVPPVTVSVDPPVVDPPVVDPPVVVLPEPSDGIIVDGLFAGDFTGTVTAGAPIMLHGWTMQTEGPGVMSIGTTPAGALVLTATKTGGGAGYSLLQPLSTLQPLTAYTLSIKSRMSRSGPKINVTILTTSESLEQGTVDVDAQDISFKTPESVTGAVLQLDLTGFGVGDAFTISAVKIAPVVPPVIQPAPLHCVLALNPIEMPASCTAGQTCPVTGTFTGQVTCP